jgi:hypothetical protein
MSPLPTSPRAPDPVPARPRRRSQRGQNSSSIIAGVAAMITAVGGTVGVLYQTGVIGHHAAAPATTPSTGASPSPSGSASPYATETPGSTASPSPGSSPTANPSPTPTPGTTPTPTGGGGILFH